MFSRERRADTINGILLVLLFAVAAIQIDRLPWVHGLGISPLIVGILLGIVYANTLHHRLPRAWVPGIGFSARQILRLAIVLYGFHITLQEIASIGLNGIGVALIMMSSTLGLGYWLGVHWLGLDRQTAILTGAGSAICGAAAIMAFEPVVQARGHQTSSAVATVVLFGTVAMFLYPMLCHLGIVALSSDGWGMYIGATVHEVAQVVGAGSDIGRRVADVAVIVKMTRVLLIVPALLVVGWWSRRMAAGTCRATPLTVPWFALGFVAMVSFNSLDLLPPAWLHSLRSIDRLLLTMAMTALGMETHMGKLKGVGIRPFILAAVLFSWLLLGGYATVQLLSPGVQNPAILP